MLVLSLNQTIEYLHSKYSKSEMTWGNFHQHYYKNNPFGQTPLKYFFDKSIPAAGNQNTINMGDYLLWDFENSKFRSMYSANLKLVAELGVGVYYSIDTGNSDSIFSEFYFNMNERHLSQNLYPMLTIKQLKEKGKTTPDIIFKGRNITEEENLKEDL